MKKTIVSWYTSLVSYLKRFSFKAFYGRLVFLVVSVLVFFFIKDVFTYKVRLTKFDLHVDTDNDYSNDVAIQLLQSKIFEVYKTANSLRGVDPRVESKLATFSIEISGLKSNYSSIISFSKEQLGLKSGVLRATVLKEDDEYKSLLMLDDEVISSDLIKFDSLTSSMNQLDSIFTIQAIHVVEKVDPYIASLFFFKMKQYKKCIKLAKESLKKDKKSKMFALGTIANSYRELKYFSNSDLYYKKCLSEFPDFDQARWEYASMLVLEKRYDDAIKQLKKISTTPLKKKSLQYMEKIKQEQSSM